MEFSRGARPRTRPRQARRATLDAPTSGASSGHHCVTGALINSQEIDRQARCARPARSNFARPARSPSRVQRLVFSREAAPSVQPHCESEAPTVRNRCAGHNQRSRALVPAARMMRRRHERRRRGRCDVNISF
ncbi:hypothetical protein F511_01815 [Dorcoceras hygrometricum]|uniref:Uncharacterized protein n=1 Tax=Dorcoceras hygrometricum TaxID=472368 RepID=A0A2Z7AS96_9LAMI|nr:hypothetical protein F511_01815 [Dorcoceras hygrometricum]